jgi:hypothetical protein
MIHKVFEICDIFQTACFELNLNVVFIHLSRNGWTFKANSLALKPLFKQISLVLVDFRYYYLYRTLLLRGIRAKTFVYWTCQSYRFVQKYVLMLVWRNCKLLKMFLVKVCLNSWTTLILILIKIFISDCFIIRVCQRMLMVIIWLFSIFLYIRFLRT